MRKYKMLVIIFIFLLTTIGNAISEGSEFKIDHGTIRAVSINRLQQRLQSNKKKDIYSQEILELGAVNEILGIILDDTNNDIILIGSTDTSFPAIYTEDFVVALRNAWMRYADFRGNTYYYSNPGCSIDPNQQIMQKLNTVGRKVLSSTTIENTKEILKEWHGICRNPQNVRIMGIPINSHFAKVMIKADYDMKNIVNGTDNVGISGLYSLMDMKENQILKDIHNKKSISISISMNRFWFYPGKNIYEESEGVLLIKECPVHLLTENEYNSSGSKEDPLAIQFSHDITAHYGELAEKRLIYKELENLFRLVSIAKILKYKNTGSIEDRLSYLLNDFLLTEIKVEQSLPGQSIIREFEHREELPDGYRIFHMWLPSCGGVDININPDQDYFHTPMDNLFLQSLKRKILNQKSPNNFYWDVDLD